MYYANQSRDITVYHYVLLLIFFSLVRPDQAEVYRWQDQEGKVYFGGKNSKGARPDTRLKIIQTKVHREFFNIQISPISTPLSDQERDRIRRDINNVYQFFDQVLYFDIYQPVKIKIKIFNNATSYAVYVSQQVGQCDARSLGVYIASSHEIVTFIHPERDSTFRTLKHETAHAIIDIITPFTETWLNEGLAEQMETLEKTNNQLVIGKHSNNLAQVLHLKQQQQLPSLRLFFSLPGQQWRNHYEQTGISLQSQAGTMVYFLMSTIVGRQFITKVSHSYQRGNQTLPYHGVDKHFLGGVNSLTALWQQWLNEPITEQIAL